MLDPKVVKLESESAILADGGKICDWLPFIDPSEHTLRDGKAIAQRGLILSVLVHVSFGAPQKVALDWLEANNLRSALSRREADILTCEQDLTESARIRLRWNVESLWTIAWIGRFFDGLTPLQPISNELAGQFPNLRKCEPDADFYQKFSVRGEDEIFRALDLFYRAHWFARNSHMIGEDSSPFNLGIIQYRRIPLEWALNDAVDWDDVDLST